MFSTLPGENKKVVIILMHVCAWVAFDIFIYIANVLTKPDIRVLNVVLFLVPHCLTFYISLYCLNLFKRIGIIWRIASFFLAFLVMACIGYGYVYLLLPSFGIRLYSTNSYREFLKAALLGYVQYFAFAVLYFYLGRTIKKERELRIIREAKLKDELENAKLKENELQAEKERLLLEYAFLRSQVNPHFLYNTLNALFSQALEYSDELAGNISKLSKIMRYSLQGVDKTTDKVPVRQELENLQLLIEINNVRFEESMEIDFSILGKIKDQMLPPLSMITVVENAFKYGELSDPDFPLTIRVILNPGEVFFFCRNKKGKQKIEDSSQSGIANLKKRLEMSFAGQYEMNSKDENGLYTFELRIFNKACKP